MLRFALLLGVVAAMPVVEETTTTTMTTPFMTTTTSFIATTIEPMTCAKKCIDTVAEQFKIAQLIGDIDAALSDVESKMHVYDQNTIDEFCQFYDELTMCMRKCGTHPKVDMPIEVFKPIDYICVEKYDSFVKFAGCFNNVYNDKTMRAVCSSQCGTYEDIKEKTIMMRSMVTEMGTDIDMDKVPAVVDAIDDVCTYTSCMTDCRKEQFWTMCKTYEPYYLIREFFAKAMGTVFTFIEEFKPASDIDISAFVPPSCKKIADFKTAHIEKVATTTTTTFVSTTVEETFVPIVEHCTVPFTFTIDECPIVDMTVETFDVFYFNNFDMECSKMTIPITCTDKITSFNCVNMFDSFEKCWMNCKSLIMETPIITKETVEFQKDAEAMKKEDEDEEKMEEASGEEIKEEKKETSMWSDDDDLTDSMSDDEQVLISL